MLALTSLRAACVLGPAALLATSLSWSSPPFPNRSGHWAFQPLAELSIPHVTHAHGVKTPVDRFILAKLEARSLSFAPAADKHALLRRATYDLTGLPPAPEEVEAFVADESPDAFAKVVERLLASTRYGARWGRHWLDLVRYSDDFEDAWRYRDWVVHAFQTDFPYDRFVVSQIAGDRLPAQEPGEVNADGIIATTMLSIGQWGGLDRRKRMADIVDDQIDVIGRTFLGLTFACARCHDHKFDPITTTDYYGLAGYFYSSRVMSDTAYLSHGTHRLRIPLVTAEAVKNHERHAAQVRALEGRLEREIDKHYAAFANSLVPEIGRYLLAAWDYQNRSPEQASLSVEEFATARELQASALTQWLAYIEGKRLGDYRLLDVPIRDYDGEAGVHVWGASAERPWWGVNTTQNNVPIETFLLPPRSASVNPGTDGGAVGWKSPITGKVRISGTLVDADPHDGTGVDWAVDHHTGNARYELSSGSLPNGSCRELANGRNPERLDLIEVQAGDMIQLQIWLHDGDAHYDITNVDFTITRVDGPGQWDLTRDSVADFLAANPHHDSLGNADVWHFYDMAGSNRKQRMPALDPLLNAWHDTVAKLAAGLADRCALEQVADQIRRAADDVGGPVVSDLIGVRSPFRVKNRDDARYLSPMAQTALARLADERKAVKESGPELPTAHGIAEGGNRYGLFPGIRHARVHIRGDYSQLGDEVPRRVPRIFASGAPPATETDSGRLELARWIASPDHPLTARVMVNRIWQQHFGEGIVRTPSNLGELGERPTHPELLDYLARKFIESGWSVKAMHRLIMLSAAYQQSSNPLPAALQIDPDNQLFSRMIRRRLDAEAIRDSILSISGSFDERIGGPCDADASSRRRMLYLRTSRADRSGFGPLFDCADASIHVERRTISTAAPQALFLMNDEFVIGSARRIVNRSEIAREADSERRVQSLYRLVFGRPASADEVAIGRRFVETLHSESHSQRSSPDAPLGPWETYAQALILSNQFLFVD